MNSPLTTLTIVCVDGSTGTARFIIDEDCNILDVFGPVISTLVSMTDDVILHVHEHEFPNAAMAEPLLAYLESCGSNNNNSSSSSGRDPFDIIGQIKAAPDAVRFCYEAACERINIPYFVKGVDLEVLTMLADNVQVPRAFIGNPRIDTMCCNHMSITRSMIRRAAEKYSAIVIVMEGGKRAIASFNMTEEDDANRLFSGQSLLKWMLSEHRLDGDVVPEIPHGQHHIVYTGNTDPDDFNRVKNPDYSGMERAEFTFAGFIGDLPNGAQMALAGEDVTCPNGTPLHLQAVDAIIGYGDANDNIKVVYARNDVWRNKVWMDPADYVL
jgi:hypothetical protein